MSKYKITIEAIDPNADRLGDKTIECDGFAIIADLGEDDRVAIRGMSILDLGAALAENDNTFTATCIAKALREAYHLQDKGRKADPIEQILRGLSGLGRDD